MGITAARILVQRLSGGEDPREVSMEPELIVRESTGPARDLVSATLRRRKSSILLRPV